MTGETPEPPCLTAALAYAARGLRVLPLYAPTADGGCTCRRPDCNAAGKHPRTTKNGGVHAATDNADRIRSWWQQWPDANVGIAAAGLLVVDVDGPAGEAALANLDLPPTPTVRTAKGRHYYFRDVAGKGCNAIGLFPQVDVKAAGGQVAAAPSLHASGTSYAWEPGRSLEDLPIAPAPAWLYEALADRGDRPPRGEVGDQPIREGQRNETLVRLAGAWVADGVDLPTVEERLHQVNATRCQPPLPAREVRAILRSAARWDPTPGGERVRVPRAVVRAGLADGPLALYCARQAYLQREGRPPKQKELAAILAATPRSVRSWQAQLRLAGLDQYERPTRRYVPVPVAALVDPQVSPAAKVTAVHVAAYANSDEDRATVAAVGQVALAKHRGKDPATVRRHVHELQAHGHLLVYVAPFDSEVGRRVRPNRYAFTAMARPETVGEKASKRKQVRDRQASTVTERKQVRGESRPAPRTPPPGVGPSPSPLTAPPARCRSSFASRSCRQRSDRTVRSTAARPQEEPAPPRGPGLLEGHHAPPGGISPAAAAELARCREVYGESKLRELGIPA